MSWTITDVLATCSDKMMKNVYIVDDYLTQLWQSSKLTVFFLVGAGFVAGFVTKMLMTPKVKERVKLVKMETKKLK
jgi:hypothetical protein